MKKEQRMAGFCQSITASFGQRCVYECSRHLSADKNGTAVHSVIYRIKLKGSDQFCPDTVLTIKTMLSHCSGKHNSKKVALSLERCCKLKKVCNTSRARAPLFPKLRPHPKHSVILEGRSRASAQNVFFKEALPPQREYGFWMTKG